MKRLAMLPALLAGLILAACTGPAGDIEGPKRVALIVAIPDKVHLHTEQMGLITGGPITDRLIDHDNSFVREIIVSELTRLLGERRPTWQIVATRTMTDVEARPHEDLFARFIAPAEPDLIIAVGPAIARIPHFDSPYPRPGYGLGIFQMSPFDGDFGWPFVALSMVFGDPTTGKPIGRGRWKQYGEPPQFSEQSVWGAYREFAETGEPDLEPWRKEVERGVPFLVARLLETHGIVGLYESDAEPRDLVY